MGPCSIRAMIYDFIGRTLSSQNYVFIWHKTQINRQKPWLVSVKYNSQLKSMWAAFGAQPVWMYSIGSVMLTRENAPKGRIWSRWINSLRRRQNGRHFADDIFKCIFLNENVWAPIKISLKVVPKGLINNIPALVKIMAWRRPGGKPLSEPVVVNLMTHICVTRPQWVNPDKPNWQSGPVVVSMPQNWLHTMHDR